MNAKIYLTGIDDEEINEVFTYGKILRTDEREAKHKKNQYTLTEKVYYCLPLLEKPDKIDKYLDQERVEFLEEPKIFAR